MRPKHLLALDDVIYMLKPDRLGLLRWTDTDGDSIGSPYVNETEALNWTRLMLKYEWAGRGKLLEKPEGDDDDNLIG